MRRILSLLLAVVLSVFLIGCKANAKKSGKDKSVSEKISASEITETKDNNSDKSDTSSSLSTNESSGEKVSSNTSKSNSENKSGNNSSGSASTHVGTPKKEELTNITEITDSNISIANQKVLEICNNPDKYTDKTVTIKGVFLVKETDARNYYACYTAALDAHQTAGFEFTLKDQSLKYPDDFPKANDKITVKGKYHKYTENGKEYNELYDAEIIEK